MQQPNIQLRRGFLAVMSNGPDIALDQDEIDAVQRLAAQGSFIRVRQGIINPSFLVSIVEDTKREIVYGPGARGEQKRLGMRPLKDILAKKEPVFALPGRPDGTDSTLNA